MPRVRVNRIDIYYQLVGSVNGYGSFQLVARTTQFQKGVTS